MSNCFLCWLIIWVRSDIYSLDCLLLWNNVVIAVNTMMRKCYQCLNLSDYQIILYNSVFYCLKHHNIICLIVCTIICAHIRPIIYSHICHLDNIDSLCNYVLLNTFSTIFASHKVDITTCQHPYIFKWSMYL